MDKLLITIDSRETALYNSLTDRDLDEYKDKIEICKENLELGDICIKYNDIHFVFERKSVQDLIASIKDGRYKEQKARLLSTYKRRNVSYIIEGDNAISSQPYVKNARNMLLGAYYHTMYRDNLRTIYVKNIEETATFILTLAVKILENPSKFLTVYVVNEERYCDVVKMKSRKIDNIYTKVCYIMQLSQIPHISSTIAKNIASVYPTMKELLDALCEYDSIEDRINLLCKIDKIGKEKAKLILQYMSLDSS